MAGSVCAAAAGALGIGSASAREVRAGASTGVEGQMIGANQFIQLAEEVTRKMMASDNFLAIISQGEKPRLVVGNVGNRTMDETIFVGDIARKISEIIIESGLVRWFEYGAISFDLIVNPVLTGTRIANRRKVETVFTLTLSLSDVNGEVKGRWSADRAYVN
jgi:hypothetical protein